MAVVDGVKVAASFGYNRNGVDAHAANVSGTVDVAKLADMSDMSLSVSGMYILGFGAANVAVDKFFAAVKAGAGAISGAVQYWNDGANKLAASANYALDDATNVGLYMDTADLTDFANEWTLEASADYSISDITTYGGLGYTFGANVFYIYTGIEIAY